MMRTMQPLAPFDQVIVKIERLPDGSITIRAHSEGTQRVLLDRVFIVKGGFEHGTIHVTPDGLNWELS